MNDVDLTLDISKTIDTLSFSEKRILSMIYGLKDIPMTKTEVAKELSISLERVRQLEARALRRLRHPSRANGIRAYAEEKFGIFKFVDKKPKESESQKIARIKKEENTKNFLVALDNAGIKYQKVTDNQYKTGDFNFWPSTGRWTHKYYNSRYEFKPFNGEGPNSLVQFLILGKAG